MTTGYRRLQDGFHGGYQGLQPVIGDYKGLGVRSVYTEGYKGLEWSTRGYRGLQGVTWCYRGLR